jgi:zinc and cadmium transporter
MGFSLLILVLGPLIGGVIAFYSTLLYEKQLKLFLSFAGAYLLSVTLTQLIPEAFQTFETNKGLFVLLGFLFQVFLERFSEGVEHGHLHLNKHLKNKVIPTGILVSMGFHSYTEGIPLGAFNPNETAGWALIIGIFLHEIPATFTMVTLLKGIKISKRAILISLALYACMSPMGALSSGFVHQLIPSYVFDYLLAFVIGTFLHISTTILFESSEKHAFPKAKLLAIILGISAALLVTKLIHIWSV